MASEVNEIRTYFGRCRCCLEYGYLKNMWTVHHWEGDSEIYGEMITECFAFTLERPNNVDHDQICETCISRLRDACSFKYTVIKSQRLLMQEIPLGGDTVSIKLEDVKPEGSIEIDIDDQIIDNTQDMLEENIDLGIPIITEEAVVIDELPYEDVEYLEEEVVGDKTKQHSEDLKPVDSDGSGPSKRKWPKKLPRNERNQRYLQYTEEDLRKGIEAVKSQKMSRLEASEYYNVPRKTLCARLRMEAERAESDPDREERYRFLKEIKTILTFTNGTPFKTRVCRFSCAYCVDECFDDAVDLRNHTRTVHIDDRTKKVDLMLRPYWMNEILKLDIENLMCVVCCDPIYDWNGMFKHLKDKHGIQLDLAYRRVIPFTLDPDLKCALCKHPHINYMQLDGHMNSHYDNYVCGNCGDTFLTAPRLKSHMRIHVVGKYPCAYCEKVFRLEHYRRKHEAVVHKKWLYYKCSYCSTKFGSEKERNNHMADMHSDQMKVITCEQCGKTFKWRHYFLSHVRKTHSGKKYQCEHCDKRFMQKEDLDCHIAAKHNGEKKYQCKLCDKKYSSRPGLGMHMKIHKSRNE